MEHQKILIYIYIQKILLLTTAAKRIKTDIDPNVDPKFYPSLDTMEHSATLSFLPSSLLLFLYNITDPGNELKLVAIGHSIMQAAQPRKTLSRLQIVLTMQM